MVCSSPWNEFFSGCQLPVFFLRLVLSFSHSLESSVLLWLAAIFCCCHCHHVTNTCQRKNELEQKNLEETQIQERKWEVNLDAEKNLQVTEWRLRNLIFSRIKSEECWIMYSCFNARIHAGSCQENAWNQRATRGSKKVRKKCPFICNGDPCTKFYGNCTSTPRAPISKWDGVWSVNFVLSNLSVFPAKTTLCIIWNLAVGLSLRAQYFHDGACRVWGSVPF